jgi:phage FluMu protein Com
MSINHGKGEQKCPNVLAKRFVRKKSEKVWTIRRSCNGKENGSVEDEGRTK